MVKTQSSFVPAAAARVYRSTIGRIGPAGMWITISLGAVGPRIVADLRVDTRMSKRRVDNDKSDDAKVERLRTLSETRTSERQANHGQDQPRRDRRYSPAARQDGKGPCGLFRGQV